MSEKLDAAIFDMDGTLYRFKNGGTFTTSGLGAQVKSNVMDFIGTSLSLGRDDAEKVYRDIRTSYDENISLGLEYEYGIDRYDYFNSTWDIDPEPIIDFDPRITKTLRNLSTRAVLLTSAPQVWSKKVLRQMNVEDAFEEIYTGEADIRKPNPAIFSTIAINLGMKSGGIVSIGDQEWSDIVPAKSIGMRTVLIAEKTTESSADITVPSLMDGIEKMETLQWL